jgi:elongation factor Ts
MMDCKKALVEANGDFEAAVDILRKMGQKVAAKRADRDATEGCVLAGTTDDKAFGAIVAVNCETDFVAKNEGFVTLTTNILNLALANRPATSEALLALPYAGGMTVGEKLVEQTGVIGEKIELTAYEVVNANYVATYIHHGNKLATLVGLTAEAAEAGKDVAMQAAAMNPVALNRDSVPQSIIDRELDIARELALQEGKPADMVDKIAQGRLGKFFKESTLVEQEFIKDNKKSIAQYLTSVKAGLEVVAFKRVGLGV